MQYKVGRIGSEKVTYTRSKADLCGMDRLHHHPYLLPIVVVLLVTLRTSLLFSHLMGISCCSPSHAVREGWAVGEIATFFAGFFDLARPVSAFWVFQLLRDAHL